MSTLADISEAVEIEIEDDFPPNTVKNSVMGAPLEILSNALTTPVPTPHLPPTPQEAPSETPKFRPAASLRAKLSRENLLSTSKDDIEIEVDEHIREVEDHIPLTAPPIPLAALELQVSPLPSLSNNNSGNSLFGKGLSPGVLSHLPSNSNSFSPGKPPLPTRRASQTMPSPSHSGKSSSSGIEEKNPGAMSLGGSQVAPTMSAHSRGAPTHTPSTAQTLGHAPTLPTASSDAHNHATLSSHMQARTSNAITPPPLSTATSGSAPPPLPDSSTMASPTPLPNNSASAPPSVLLSTSTKSPPLQPEVARALTAVGAATTVVGKDASASSGNGSGNGDAKDEDIEVEVEDEAVVKESHSDVKENVVTKKENSVAGKGDRRDVSEIAEVEDEDGYENDFEEENIGKQGKSEEKLNSGRAANVPEKYEYEADFSDNEGNIPTASSRISSTRRASSSALLLTQATAPTHTHAATATASTTGGTPSSTGAGAASDNSNGSSHGNGSGAGSGGDSGAGNDNRMGTAGNNGNSGPATAANTTTRTRTPSGADAAAIPTTVTNTLPSSSSASCSSSFFALSHPHHSSHCCPGCCTASTCVYTHYMASLCPGPAAVQGASLRIIKKPEVMTESAATSSTPLSMGTNVNIPVDAFPRSSKMPTSSVSSAFDTVNSLYTVVPHDCLHDRTRTCGVISSCSHHANGIYSQLVEIHRENQNFGKYLKSPAHPVGFGSRLARFKLPHMRYECDCVMDGNKHTAACASRGNNGDGKKTYIPGQNPARMDDSDGDTDNKTSGNKSNGKNGGKTRKFTPSRSKSRPHTQQTCVEAEEQPAKRTVGNCGNPHCRQHGHGRYICPSFLQYAITQYEKGKKNELSQVGEKIKNPFAHLQQYYGILSEISNYRVNSRPNSGSRSISRLPSHLPTPITPTRTRTSSHTRPAATTSVNTTIHTRTSTYTSDSGNAAGGRTHPTTASVYLRRSSADTQAALCSVHGPDIYQCTAKHKKNCTNEYCVLHHPENVRAPEKPSICTFYGHGPESDEAQKFWNPELPTLSERDQKRVERSVLEHYGKKDAGYRISLTYCDRNTVRNSIWKNDITPPENWGSVDFSEIRIEDVISFPTLHAIETMADSFSLNNPENLLIFPNSEVFSTPGVFPPLNASSLHHTPSHVPYDTPRRASYTRADDGQLFFGKGTAVAQTLLDFIDGKEISEKKDSSEKGIVPESGVNEYEADFDEETGPKAASSSSAPASTSTSTSASSTVSISPGFLRPSFPDLLSSSPLLAAASYTASFATYLCYAANNPNLTPPPLPNATVPQDKLLGHSHSQVYARTHAQAHYTAGYGGSGTKSTNSLDSIGVGSGIGSSASVSHTSNSYQNIPSLLLPISLSPPAPASTPQLPTSSHPLSSLLPLAQQRPIHPHPCRHPYSGPHHEGHQQQSPPLHPEQQSLSTSPLSPPPKPSLVSQVKLRYHSHHPQHHPQHYPSSHHQDLASDVYAPDRQPTPGDAFASATSPRPLPIPYASATPRTHALAHQYTTPTHHRPTISSPHAPRIAPTTPIDAATGRRPPTRDDDGVDSIDIDLANSIAKPNNDGASGVSERSGINAGTTGQCTPPHADKAYTEHMYMNGNEKHGNLSRLSEIPVEFRDRRKNESNNPLSAQLSGKNTGILYSPFKSPQGISEPQFSERASSPRGRAWTTPESSPRKIRKSGNSPGIHQSPCTPRKNLAFSHSVPVVKMQRPRCDICTYAFADVRCGPPPTTNTSTGASASGGTGYGLGVDAYGADMLSQPGIDVCSVTDEADEEDVMLMLSKLNGVPSSSTAVENRNNTMTKGPNVVSCCHLNLCQRDFDELHAPAVMKHHIPIPIDFIRTTTSKNVY